MSVQQTAGRLTTDTLTVENNGTASGEVSAFLMKGNSTALTYGPFHPSGRHFGPKDLLESDVSKIRYFSSESIPELAPGEAYGAFDTEMDSGWGVSIDRNTGEFFISDLNSSTIVANFSKAREICC